MFWAIHMAIMWSYETYKKEFCFQEEKVGYFLLFQIVAECNYNKSLCMYDPFIFAVLEFLRCFWCVVDILCMMPYSLGVNYVHVTGTQYIPLILTHITPFGVNVTAVCKGESHLKSKIHLCFERLPYDCHADWLKHVPV